jgi:hypothetical protein
VTVWSIASLFVQVTVVPTETVRLGGEKLMLAIFTVLPVAGGGVVDMLPYPLFLLQEMSDTAEKINKKTTG